MRKLATWLLCCLSLATYSQEIPGIVSAEQAFAKYAVDSSIKAAFLYFMDSSAVVFENGKIYAARDLWQNAPVNTYKLLWRPAFYACSVNNDLGFTTGPFELRRTLTDTILASGQYTTVWIKTTWGEWKFIADMGIHYQPSQYQQQIMEKAPALIPVATAVNVMELENRFIRNYHSNGPRAYINNIIPETWFNHEKQGPRRGKHFKPEQQQKQAAFTFTPIAGGLSASRDLAYVYGNTQVDGRAGNYLRLWAHTAAGWIILLEVIAGS